MGLFSALSPHVTLKLMPAEQIIAANVGISVGGGALWEALCEIHTVVHMGQKRSLQMRKVKEHARDTQLSSGSQDLSLVLVVSGAQELKSSAGLKITNSG